MYERCVGLVGCCADKATGMNKSSHALCPALPCGPPGHGEQVQCGSGYITDDCDVAASFADVGTECVDHQCRTFVAVAP